MEASATEIKAAQGEFLLLAMQTFRLRTVMTASCQYFLTRLILALLSHVSICVDLLSNSLASAAPHSRHLLHLFDILGAGIGSRKCVAGYINVFLDTNECQLYAEVNDVLDAVECLARKPAKDRKSEWMCFCRHQQKLMSRQESLSDDMTTVSQDELAPSASCSTSTRTGSSDTTLGDGGKAKSHVVASLKTSSEPHVSAHNPGKRSIRKSKSEFLLSLGSQDATCLPNFDANCKPNSVKASMIGPVPAIECQKEFSNEGSTKNETAPSVVYNFNSGSSFTVNFQDGSHNTFYNGIPGRRILLPNNARSTSDKAVSVGQHN